MRIRDNRDEISRLYGHRVLINAELEVHICRDINQSHPVSLSRNDLKNTKLTRPGREVFILSVDEACVRGNIRRDPFSVPDSKDGVMEVILEENGPQVDVPVGASRAVNDKRTDETIRILEGKVTVVPGCAVCCCAEPISERITGWDGT